MFSGCSWNPSLLATGRIREGQHSNLGRGSKRQLVDFDLVNPRLGARRGRTAQDRGPKAFPFKVFCGERVGDSSTVEQRTLLYSGGGGQALSG